MHKPPPPRPPRLIARHRKLAKRLGVSPTLAALRLRLLLEPNVNLLPV